MKYLIKFAIIVFFTLTLNSCKKEETPVKTKTELICNGNWIAKSFTVNPGIDVGGVVITDWYTQLDACDKDDYDKFESNGLGVTNEGATKCNSADPQTSAFTWSFKNNETVLTYDSNNYDINTLNENELIYSETLDGDDCGGIPGIKYKWTITFRH